MATSDADPRDPAVVCAALHLLCHHASSLAAASRPQKKVKAHGWKNVEVVEGDACTFVPPGGLQADVVSFSYSLTMIPPFHSAIDAGNSYLKDDGFMGVADFYVSSKYDLPMRQMPWHRRFFWRSIFDTGERRRRRGTPRLARRPARPAPPALL